MICSRYWGGDCRLLVSSPTYDCAEHHAPSWFSGHGKSGGGSHWEAKVQEEIDFPEEILEDPMVTEEMIANAVSHLELKVKLLKSLAKSPNLPMDLFEKVLEVKSVPKRAEKLTEPEMIDLRETAAPVAWLSAYSDKNVPEELWRQICSEVLHMVIGPVPGTVNPDNLRLLCDLRGDPGFHHSLIRAIQKNRAPVELAFRALVGLRESSEVDTWDIAEATRLVSDYVAELNPKY